MNLQKRDIATCVILSIITCGIYAIYWEVKLAQEAISVKDPNDDGILEIVLMIFLPFLGSYLVEKKFYEGAVARNIPKSDNSIIYLILGLLVGCGTIIDFCMIQNDLNKLSDMMVPPQV